MIKGRNNRGTTLIPTASCCRHLVMLNGHYSAFPTNRSEIQLAWEIQTLHLNRRKLSANDSLSLNGIM